MTSDLTENLRREVRAQAFEQVREAHQSETAEDYVEMIADLIDGSVLEVVPGSHLFPFTHAADISVRISAFLDQPQAAQQQAAA